MFEMARSGRSTCRSCRKRIAEGECRFVREEPGIIRKSYRQILYYHSVCAVRSFPRQVLRSLNKAADFEIPKELQRELRDAVVSVIIDELNRSAEVVARDAGYLGLFIVSNSDIGDLSIEAIESSRYSVSCSMCDSEISYGAPAAMLRLSDDQDGDICACVRCACLFRKISDLSEFADRCVRSNHDLDREVFRAAVVHLPPEITQARNLEDSDIDASFTEARRKL